jgi:hypothetical protein
MFIEVKNAVVLEDDDRGVEDENLFVLFFFGFTHRAWAIIKNRGDTFLAELLKTVQI